MNNLEEFAENDLAPVCLRACLALQDISTKHKDLLKSELTIKKSLDDFIDYLDALQDVYLPCASISRNDSEKFLITETLKTR